MFVQDVSNAGVERYAAVSIEPAAPVDELIGVEQVPIRQKQRVAIVLIRKKGAVIRPADKITWWRTFRIVAWNR